VKKLITILFLALTIGAGLSAIAVDDVHATSGQAPSCSSNC
jgi:hypothetical protein